MVDSLTPEWLARANRLAMTATLLATTVHEVNNALQVISGSAETMNTSSPDVVGRRSHAIGAHARRASALLAELSSFARDDADQAVPIDLAHVAQRALNMRQYTIAKLNLESSFETRGSVPRVSARPRAVLQIVLNLLVNAEQALVNASEGRIEVWVAGDATRSMLAVDDNGCGVAADLVPMIFVPGALATDGHLGIGLAVARQLAERAGGTLCYEPRPGRGSRFTLALPSTEGAR